MPIYIQSRGASQEQDYRWLRIDSEEQKPEDPPIIGEALSIAPDLRVSIPRLIDNQTFSLVLARSRRCLVLLITGLRARQERIDYQQRQIRNSIVWLYPDSRETERLIKGLIILALEDERLFAIDIDKAIELSGELGFQARLDGIEAVEAKAKEQDVLDHFVSDNTSTFLRIGRNPDSRGELIEELIAHPFPPEQERLLVVVTSIKTGGDLIQARVWRGISNRVEAENWNNIIQDPFTTHTNQRNEQTASEGWLDIAKKSSWIYLLLGFLILIFVILALIIIPIIPKQTKPIPQTTPTPSQAIGPQTSSQDQSLQEKPTPPSTPPTLIPPTSELMNPLEETKHLKS